MMNLISIRIITADVKRLVSFYQQIKDSSLTQYTDDFAQLKTDVGTLAIGGTTTLAPFGGASIAQAATNRSVIIEFRVADVDRDYERLVDLLGDHVVQKPTTMPWGNRSLLFRDPDGNLVNFFTPVTPEARKKFDS